MKSQSEHLIILGAGGHGRVVADAAQASGRWSEIAFLDDRYPALQEAGPWRVVGSMEALAHLDGAYGGAALGVGANAVRLDHLARLRAAGIPCPAIVHPQALISPHAIIGAATVVFAGAIINIGAQIGAACIINSGAIVEHDCAIADGVHISPRAALAGAVSVGSRSWIGIGATVIQGIRIGSDVRLGAGAVVIADLPDGVTAAGVPARVMPAKRST